MLRISLPFSSLQSAAGVGDQRHPSAHLPPSHLPQLTPPDCLRGRPALLQHTTGHQQHHKEVKAFSVCNDWNQLVEKEYFHILACELVAYSVVFFHSRSKEMEITFPIYKKEDKDHDYHTIDGLSFLTDDIVGKWSSYGIILFCKAGPHVCTLVYLNYVFSFLRLCTSYKTAKDSLRVAWWCFHTCS